MWYRCAKHGSYNVADNISRFHVHCLACECEEENPEYAGAAREFLKKPLLDINDHRSPEFDGDDLEWERFLEALPKL